MKIIFIILATSMVVSLSGCKHHKESNATINKAMGVLEEMYNLQVKEGEIEGTLTLPEEKNFDTVAIIIAGSGPTDRDGNNLTVGENNCLKMIAHSLGKEGIATLRYDKRGIGESQSLVERKEDLIFTNHIDDLNLWIDKLGKDNRFKNIVIIGHCEGALIGAESTVEKDIKGYISIAGVGENGADALERQLKALNEQIYEQGRPILEDLKMGKLTNNPPREFEPLFRPSMQPYLISWFKHDPCKVIEKIQVPILIIQGANDFQVTVEDAKKLKEGNPESKLVIIDNMNHMLKDAPKDRKGNLETYCDPELPLNTKLVEEIVSFIKGL